MGHGTYPEVFDGEWGRLKKTRFSVSRTSRRGRIILTSAHQITIESRHVMVAMKDAYELITPVSSVNDAY